VHLLAGTVTVPPTRVTVPIDWEERASLAPVIVSEVLIGW